MGPIQEVWVYRLLCFCLHTFAPSARNWTFSYPVILLFLLSQSSLHCLIKAVLCVAEWAEKDQLIVRELTQKVCFLCVGCGLPLRHDAAKTPIFFAILSEMPSYAKQLKKINWKVNNTYTESQIQSEWETYESAVHLILTVLTCLFS